MSEIIEGIDYIFDRYSYLNISSDASLDTIKTEIRKRRAENHPDKLIRVSGDIKNLAKRNMELIDECDRILTNDALRNLYDLKLKDFQNSHPELVSTNGTPIISPYKFKINLSYLLNDESILDMSKLEAFAATQSGYNEKKLNKARKQFNNEADDDSREELRAQLTAKFIYLNVLEDYFWQKAGINGAVHPNENTHIQSSEDILVLFQEKLSKIEENVEFAVESRNGISLLGFTAPLLLTNDNKVDSNANDSQKAIITKVINQFTIRSEDLKNLVEDKVKTLEELCSPQISRNKQIKTIDSDIHDFFLIANPNGDSDDELIYKWPTENIELIGFSLRLNTKEKKVESFSYESSVLSLEDIANYPNNLWIIDPNPELDAPMIETMSLINSLVDD